MNFTELSLLLPGQGFLTYPWPESANHFTWTVTQRTDWQSSLVQDWCCSLQSSPHTPIFFYSCVLPRKNSLYPSGHRWV
jgi:hypothetical protein